MLIKYEKKLSTNKPTALLLLENGDLFWGYGLGAQKEAIGELCFNTSQTGYQEILTDPSYNKQIITFTFPHIGIVGTNQNDHESSKSFASGCVLSSELNQPSNWRMQNTLSNWLLINKLPCITNIDTRLITKILSKKGALKAALVYFGDNEVNINSIKKKIDDWKGLKDLDLAKDVSTLNPYKFNVGKWNHDKNEYDKNVDNSNAPKVVCIDYGAKKNILRSLSAKNLDLIVLPANSSFEEIYNYKPKGIFLSNGPGDPFATSKYAVPVINKLINKEIPIFGICLGHQILCIAFGAKTKKNVPGA